MYMLTAVRDEIKLVKLLTFLRNLCLRLHDTYFNSLVQEWNFVDLRGCYGHVADRRALLHTHSEKAALQDCVIIEMLGAMTSVIVWVLRASRCEDDCCRHLAPKGWSLFTSTWHQKLDLAGGGKEDLKLNPLLHCIIANAGVFFF
jgi:hypothetical protein